MKQETKRTIHNALVTAAMVTPPWNIFWWAVGGIAYVATGSSKDDASGDGALALVFFAPVTLPMMPFLLLKERYDLREYEKRQQLYAKAAYWIAAELAKSDISVQGHGVGFQCANVKATPTGTEQEHEHAIVYSMAVRHFVPQGLTIEEICGQTEPLHLLDRTWAEANGFTAWAEEVFTGDCVDCGNRQSLGWHFGQASERMRKYELSRRTRIVFNDGSERTVEGHICGECLKKIDCRFVSS